MTGAVSPQREAVSEFLPKKPLWRATYKRPTGVGYVRAWTKRHAERLAFGVGFVGVERVR